MAKNLPQALINANPNLNPVRSHYAAAALQGALLFHKGIPFSADSQSTLCCALEPPFSAVATADI